MHSVQSSPVFMFWGTDMRLAPPDVKETYCISRKCRTYMLLWSWQCIEAVCSSATFLPNGSDERQQSGRMKAAGCWFESGQCVGPLITTEELIRTNAVVTRSFGAEK